MLPVITSLIDKPVTTPNFFFKEVVRDIMLYMIMRTLFGSLSILLCFFSVNTAYAQVDENVQNSESESRFITCSGPDCSACNLVEMGNELIKWLFGFIFLIFAVLMMIAGFGLVTSGGNPSALQSAKDKFTNALIGLVIVMSAWLIVDTLMKGLVKNGGELEGWGPWAEVQCQVQTAPNATVGGNPGGGVTATTTGNGDDTGTCSNVTPLSPITDPFAQRMEAGDRVIFNNQNLEACVNKFIGQVGGTVTSAYRPAAYQNHLYEVSTKACQLRNNNDPQCSALKAEIERERVNHGLPLCGDVAQNNSTHSSGNGVDISGINHQSAAVRQAAQDSCLVWKNYRNDPFHYDYTPGCTCN